MRRQFACGSKEVKFPFSRFPLRGKAGAGGFPPQEGCAPLCIPAGAIASVQSFRLATEFNFALAETIAAG
jgi:hypothetical protein